MFLRFSKGKFSKDGKRQYRKCIFLGDSLVMEYGDSIVGIARLHNEDEKLFEYDVIVAKHCELGSDKIAMSIKDMIGKSNKFAKDPSKKRRKYYVEEVECDALPIQARLTFSKLQ